MRLEPGKYTVVLEPTAVGDLRAVCSRSRFQRAHGGGGPVVPEQEGRRHAARREAVSRDRSRLRTDPFDRRLPDAAGEREDLPARPVTWIEKGVVKNLSYDRYWAAKTGKQPTPVRDI